MAKHSRNNTARSYHTYHEKKKYGYGTQKIRLGSDSMQRFGHCGLTLQPAQDPVCTPQGHIFSRDAIVECLAAQRLAIKQQEAKWQKQEEEKRIEKVREGAQQQEKALQALEDVEVRQAVAPQLASTTQQGAGMAQTAGFWLPENAPEASDAEIKKPSTKLRCPVSNAVLRMKDLVPVKLEWEPKSSGEMVDRVMCAVTKDPITFQKAVALKPSGVVILESCLKDLVMPTMTCPLSGKKLRKKDIVNLVSGGTGFSAHNKVEASKHQHHKARNK